MAIFGKLLYLYNVQVVVVFISVLFVLMLFEGFVHVLEVECTKRGFKALIKKLYREFMIMGFISFAILFVSYEATSYSANKWYEAFDFAHIVLMFVGITFIVQALVLVALINMRNTQLLTYDNSSAESLIVDYIQMHTHSVYNGLYKHIYLTVAQFFFNYGPITLNFPILREKVEYKIIQEFFIRSYNLPAEFKFANYMCAVLKDYIISLVEVRPITWLSLAALVPLNIVRIVVVDPVYEPYVCSRYPGHSKYLYHPDKDNSTSYNDNDTPNYSRMLTSVFLQAGAPVSDTTGSGPSAYHVCEEYTLRVILSNALILTVYIFCLLAASELYMQRLMSKVLDLEEALQKLDEEQQVDRGHALTFVDGHFVIDPSLLGAAGDRSSVGSRAEMALDRLSEPAQEEGKAAVVEDTDGKAGRLRRASSGDKNKMQRWGSEEIPPPPPPAAPPSSSPPSASPRSLQQKGRSDSYTAAAGAPLSLQPPDATTPAAGGLPPRRRMSAAYRAYSVSQSMGPGSDASPAVPAATPAAAAPSTPQAPRRSLGRLSRENSLASDPFSAPHLVESHTAHANTPVTTLLTFFGENRRYLYIHSLERIMYREIEALMQGAGEGAGRGNGEHGSAGAGKSRAGRGGSVGSKAEATVQGSRTTQSVTTTSSSAASTAAVGRARAATGGYERVATADREEAWTAGAGDIEAPPSPPPSAANPSSSLSPAPVSAVVSTDRLDFRTLRALRIQHRLVREGSISAYSQGEANEAEAASPTAGIARLPSMLGSFLGAKPAGERGSMPRDQQAAGHVELSSMAKQPKETHVEPRKEAGKDEKHRARSYSIQYFEPAPPPHSSDHAVSSSEPSPLHPCLLLVKRLGVATIGMVAYVVRKAWKTIVGHHLGISDSQLRTDEDIKELEKEFHEIFLFHNPDLYYFSVEFGLLLQYVYIALWATNFVFIARDSYFPIFWEALLVLPMVLNFIVMKQVIFTSVMLKSIVQLDQRIATAICEEAVDERIVTTRLRNLLRNALRNMGVERKHWGTYVRQEFDRAAGAGGGMSVKQLKRFLHALQVHLSDDSVKRIFAVLDTDKDGGVAWARVATTLLPDYAARRMRLHKRVTRQNEGDQEKEKDAAGDQEKDAAEAQGAGKRKGGLKSGGAGRGSSKAKGVTFEYAIAPLAPEDQPAPSNTIGLPRSLSEGIRRSSLLLSSLLASPAPPSPPPPSLTEEYLHSQQNDRQGLARGDTERSQASHGGVDPRWMGGGQALGGQWGWTGKRDDLGDLDEGEEEQKHRLGSEDDDAEDQHVQLVDLDREIEREREKRGMGRSRQQPEGAARFTPDPHLVSLLSAKHTQQGQQVFTDAHSDSSQGGGSKDEGLERGEEDDWEAGEEEEDDDAVDSMDSNESVVSATSEELRIYGDTGGGEEDDRVDTDAFEDTDHSHLYPQSTHTGDSSLPLMSAGEEERLDSGGEVVYTRDDVHMDV